MLCLKVIQVFLETTYHIVKNQMLYLPTAPKIVLDWNIISVLPSDSVLSEDVLYALS